MKKQQKNIPLVSIVTPSYNQGRFIEETIVSVLTQEGEFYLEYIIMDGGSKDDSVEIIKKYERILKEGKWPIKCRGIEYSWVSAKDKGQSDAINKGFRKSKGEIIAWINSDDTYLPGAIAKASKYLEEHKDISMVYGEGYHTKEDGGIMERYYTEPFDLKRLAELCFICQPTVFLRRRVLDEVGLLDPDLHFCLDYEYWIRIAKKLKIGYLSEYLANSRLYADTKTMGKRLEAHAETVSMIKRHYGRVPNSWLYAWSRLYLERALGGDKKIFFKVLWPLLFIYKSVQVNKRIPGVPVSDIKSYLFDK